MKRRALFVGAPALALVALAVAFVSVAVGQKGQKREPQAERGPFAEGVAARIQFKNNMAPVFIREPRVKLVGGQGFIGGEVLESGVEPRAKWMLWVPVGDVSRIDEFADVAWLDRVFRRGGAKAEEKK